MPLLSAYLGVAGANLAGATLALEDAIGRSTDGSRDEIVALLARVREVHVELVNVRLRVTEQERNAGEEDPR